MFSHPITAAVTCDGLNARRQDLIDIFGLDARNCDRGNLNLRRDLASIIRSRQEIPRLGGAGEDRADANVIGAVEHGVAGLLDKRVLTPTIFSRPISLRTSRAGRSPCPTMDAIRAGHHRDVRTIVDDAQNVVAAAKFDELFGAKEEFAAFPRFFAKLEAVGARPAIASSADCSQGFWQADSVIRTKDERMLNRKRYCGAFGRGGIRCRKSGSGGIQFCGGGGIDVLRYSSIARRLRPIFSRRR